MIATRASASASELVINALRPFIPVVIVGDTTFGKPVGQYSFTFCDKVLNPVSFILRNAQGQADFFDGFPPTAPRPTISTISLATREEGSLADAFSYLRTGACGSRRCARRLRPRDQSPTDAADRRLAAAARRALNGQRGGGRGGRTVFNRPALNNRPVFKRPGSTQGRSTEPHPTEGHPPAVAFSVPRACRALTPEYPVPDPT